MVSKIKLFKWGFLSLSHSTGMVKKFIAFSGGVESTSMCVLFGKEGTPVFTDTKFEHELLYLQIDKVETAIGVPILRICAKNVDGTGVDSLEDYIRLRKFYPNQMARFCTRLFKIEPMDDFLRESKAIAN